MIGVILELDETLLDVECFMNNRPLTYLGDIAGRPNILVRGEPSCWLESTQVQEKKLDITSEATKISSSVASPTIQSW